MATNVVFNGVTYSVPTTAGESGWATTLSAYLQALASGAATTSTVKQAIRTATASPVTVVAATDYTVVTNLTVPGAVAVNLPAGVAKQVFVIVDGKGDAGTNAITIDGNGAETIAGQATYVINENSGGVMLQFDGTAWQILAGFYGTDPTFTSLTVTTLGVTGTATIGTLAATSGTVGGVAITTESNTQTLTNKTLTSPVINTPTGIVKGDVGLGNVDNTSDATKNAASATLTNKTIAAGSNTISGLADANIDAAAAIARSKLATGSASHVVINDGSGNFSSEVTLAISRGGTGLGALGTAGQALRVNAGATALEYASVGGDVVGPASSVDSEFALFNATTGKLLKRASGTGYAYGTSGVASFLTTLPATDIAGRIDGSAAASGRIGQVIAASPGVGVTPGASGAYVNVVSITLTAGLWAVSGVAYYDVGSATGVTEYITGISLTSAALDVSNMNNISQINPNTSVAAVPVGARIISVSSSTTVYLVGRLTYSTVGSSGWSTVSRLQGVRIG